MKEIAHKFVNWDVPPLERLKCTEAYRLREKINNGVKLTRKEKDYITERVNSNVYYMDSILVLGWRFSFADVLKTYVFKHYGTWIERKAMDRTALRKYWYGKITRILEVA